MFYFSGQKCRELPIVNPKGVVYWDCPTQSDACCSSEHWTEPIHFSQRCYLRIESTAIRRDGVAVADKDVALLFDEIDSAFQTTEGDLS